MKSVSFEHAVIVAIAVSASACSGTSDTLGGGAGGFDAAPSEGGTDAAHDAAADGPRDGASDATGDANPDLACMSTTSRSACDSCCATNHPGGVTTLNAAITACGCKPTECKTQCQATLCAMPQMQPDTACNNCLSATLAADAGANGCFNDVLSACQMDADCLAYFRCRGANGAACASKP